MRITSLPRASPLIGWRRISSKKGRGVTSSFYFCFLFLLAYSFSAVLRINLPTKGMSRYLCHLRRFSQCFLEASSEACRILRLSERLSLLYSRTHTEYLKTKTTVSTTIGISNSDNNDFIITLTHRNLLIFYHSFAKKSTSFYFTFTFMCVKIYLCCERPI